MSIIIPNYNGESLLERNLESVFQTEYRPFEVVLADDASRDGSVSIAERFSARNKHMRVVESERNSGAAAARNLGASLAKGEILVFLDNDAIVDPLWLRNIVDPLLASENVGAAQSKILMMDGRNVCCMGEKIIPYLGWVLLLGFGDSTAEVSSKVGGICAASCAVAVKRDVFQEVGGFDGNTVFNQFEDLDFSLRIWIAGHRIVLAPESIVYHDAREKGMNEERHRIIQYASQRNCLRMILKNYETRSVLKYLPSAVGGMLFRALIASVRHRDLVTLRGLLLALAWNAMNIGDTLEHRRRIQGSLRRVKDAVLFRNIGVRPNVFELYTEYLAKGRGF